MKSISEKQQKTINIARWFTELREVSDYEGNVPLNVITYYKLTDVTEDPSGLTPERAFLNRTDKGITKMIVTSLKEYARLLVGHNKAAMQVKAWSEGFREGTLFKSDFKDEPDYIKELVEKAYQGGKSNRYNYVARLGFTEYTLELKKISDENGFGLVFNPKTEKFIMPELEELTNLLNKSDGEKPE